MMRTLVKALAVSAASVAVIGFGSPAHSDTGWGVQDTGWGIADTGWGVQDTGWGVAAGTPSTNDTGWG